MGRTLRGFEEEFPYLGGRGDVSDAAIVQKEEDYGEDELLEDMEDDDLFGAISNAVARDMASPSSRGWLFRR